MGCGHHMVSKLMNGKTFSADVSSTRGQGYGSVKRIIHFVDLFHPKLLTDVGLLWNLNGKG